MTRVADYPERDKKDGYEKERVGGRFVTKYDPNIALEIVEHILEGKTINEICKKGSGYPHPVTFKRWIINNPQLAKAVDRARELSAQSLEEEALDTAREIKKNQRDGTQVRAFEVLLAQLRWSAERRDPAKFGTKSQVSVRVPVTINTTLDLGAASDTDKDGKSIYTITAVKTEPTENAIERARDKEFTNPLAQATKFAVKQLKQEQKPHESAPIKAESQQTKPND